MTSHKMFIALVASSSKQMSGVCPSVCLSVPSFFLSLMGRAAHV